MSHIATQGSRVTVQAVVTRLEPCERHALAANGLQTALQNPNGYRHDCEACAHTPRRYEKADE